MQNTFKLLAFYYAATGTCSFWSQSEIVLRCLVACMSWHLIWFLGYEHQIVTVKCISFQYWDILVIEQGFLFFERSGNTDNVSFASLIPSHWMSLKPSFLSRVSAEGTISSSGLYYHPDNLIFIYVKIWEHWRPHLASDSLCSQWWPWLFDPPPSTSHSLRLQISSPVTSLYIVRDYTEGHLRGRQAFYQLNSIPISNTALS